MHLSARGKWGYIIQRRRKGIPCVRGVMEKKPGDMKGKSNGADK